MPNPPSIQSHECKCNQSFKSETTRDNLPVGNTRVFRCPDPDCNEPLPERHGGISVRWFKLNEDGTRKEILPEPDGRPDGRTGSAPDICGVRCGMATRGVPATTCSASHLGH